jgi:hypothetical protein
MSGVRPFFITGANAKIKLNGKTMAFCSDFSYSVQILTQTPKVLGMYEGSSVEPLGYTVSGSFTVIRYIKDAKQNIGSAPNGISENDAGNGVGNWGSAWGSGLGSFLAKNGVGNDGRANEALDPSKFQSGTTFDIQVYQKVDPTRTVTRTLPVDPLIFTKRGVPPPPPTTVTTTVVQHDTIGVANIRNCRITQADFSMTKKGAAMQRFNFVALYVDEDSFVADFSGTGQQF